MVNLETLDATDGAALERDRLVRRTLGLLGALGSGEPPALSEADCAGVDALADRCDVGGPLFAAVRRFEPRLRARFPLCEGVYVRALGHSLHLLRRCDELALHLRDSGIPVIVLKGAALARESYDDPGARPMVDIDLLLRPDDLLRAESLVRSMGYVDALPPAAARRERRALHHLPPLRHPRFGDTVELHHALVPPSASLRFDTGPLWDRARPRRGGAAGLVLDSADQFLHLAIHLLHASPVVGRLRQLLDLHVLASRAGAESADSWPRLRERSRQLRLGEWARLAADLTARLFGTPVPRAFFEGSPALDALGPPAEFERALLAPLRGHQDAPLVDRFARRKMWLERPTLSMAARLAVSALRGNRERPGDATLSPGG